LRQQTQGQVCTGSVRVGCPQLFVGKKGLHLVITLSGREMRNEMKTPCPYTASNSTSLYAGGNCQLGLARTAYLNTVYNRIFGDFPAKNIVYTPIYIYIYIYIYILTPYIYG
jgi:hypothetical protein